jgi:hypothetical protein
VRLGDELGHFGLLTHRLDAQDLIGIEVHEAGLVQLLTADSAAAGAIGGGTARQIFIAGPDAELSATPTPVRSS